VKPFLCFVMKKISCGVIATEFLFKDRPVIKPEGSILLVTTVDGYPLPDPEVIVPGFFEKLKPVKTVKLKNGREKFLYHYVFDPVDFIFEFSENFKKFEQKFILFKKLLKEGRFDEAKATVTSIKVGSEFTYLAFYDQGYYEVYESHLPESVRILLKHLKLVHREMLRTIEEMTVNLNLS